MGRGGQGILGAHPGTEAIQQNGMGDGREKAAGAGRISARQGGRQRRAGRTCQSSGAASATACWPFLAGALLQPWARVQPGTLRCSQGAGCIRRGMGFHCCRPRGGGPSGCTALRLTACNSRGLCRRRVGASRRCAACCIRCFGGGWPGGPWVRGGAAGTCRSRGGSGRRWPAAQQAGMTGST